jgi:hypothetical protein
MHTKSTKIIRKLLELSETKEKEYLQENMNETQTDSKNRNIGDLYRGTN